MTTRLVTLDTETTGLKSKEGDRIVEVAIVEVTREPNPRHLHFFCNPEGRMVSPEAVEVHGLTDEFLSDKPTFADQIDEMEAFLGDDCDIIIHNAPFDLEFLRDEYMNAGRVWKERKVIDTLKEAAKQFPGGRHSLDALCNRFGVDTSSRTKHGALIDTKILADLYLKWFGQGGFDLQGSVSIVAKEEILQLGAMNTIVVPAGRIEVAEATGRSWDDFFAKHTV